MKRKFKPAQKVRDKIQFGKRNLKIRKYDPQQIDLRKRMKTVS
jgi:hypothetical protein